MTDTTHDLVKRARSWDQCWPSRDIQRLVPEMADRIEELENICNQTEWMALDYATQVKELEAKLARAMGALDEAVYLLAPTEKDMERQAGVYRIVTTIAELSKERSDEKGQDDEGH